MAACRVSGLFAATNRCLQRGKIVIPPMPPGSPDGASSASGRASEYHMNKHIHPDTAAFLDSEGAESLRRHLQLSEFSASTEEAAEKLWLDSKPHLRKQREMVRELGVEGAVREALSPSKTSFREDLRQRPLDRGILEEIYRGLHGRRIERQLRKGVSWEHWITKGDGTAPVFTTSRKAQQTFAFGGQVRLLRSATHPQQFPVIRARAATTAVPPARSPSARRGPGPSSRRHGASEGSRTSTAGGVDVLEDRRLLLPEVAFIGRTSSGKSSLLNAILNATVTPYGHLQGTTNTVRFYSVAQRIVLVDCPGYGYYNPVATPAVDAENAIEAMRGYLRVASRGVSHASRGKRLGEESAVDVSELVESLDEAEGRGGRSGGGYQLRNVKRVFVCVSARGMQYSDLEYCELLENLGVPFSVVLTKTDAAPIRFLARLADYTRCQLVHYKHCKELMLTSSLRLAGIDKMQALIGDMAIGEDMINGATLDFSSIV